MGGSLYEMCPTQPNPPPLPALAEAPLLPLFWDWEIAIFFLFLISRVLNFVFYKRIIYPR
jgi:hypothetical protein